MQGSWDDSYIKQALTQWSEDAIFEALHGGGDFEGEFEGEFAEDFDDEYDNDQDTARDSIDWEEDTIQNWEEF